MISSTGGGVSPRPIASTVAPARNRVAPHQLMDALREHQVGHRVDGVGEVRELGIERDLCGVTNGGKSTCPREWSIADRAVTVRRSCDRRHALDRRDRPEWRDERIERHCMQRALQLIAQQRTEGLA